MNSSSKRLAIFGVAAAIVVVAVVVFATTRSSTTSSAAPTGDGTASSLGPNDPSSPSDTAPSDPNATADPNASTADPGVVPTTKAPADLPLDVTVSSTSGLVDGQAVTIHVTPKDGSNIYGIEAFLCAPDTTFTLDADIRPSLTGKCVTKRLSASSLDYLNKAIAPPYQVADVSFPVGVGSDSYTTQRGQNVTITCGPGHPCQLVLKLQVPYGYGFKAYPLTYR